MKKTIIGLIALCAMAFAMAAPPVAQISQISHVVAEGDTVLTRTLADNGTLSEQLCKHDVVKKVRECYLTVSSVSPDMAEGLLQQLRSPSEGVSSVGYALSALVESNERASSRANVRSVGKYESVFLAAPAEKDAVPLSGLKRTFLKN